ncbi:MAG: hypothetical protein KDN05_06545, partial [Verrucomicrobiae bacterium]|nr:hypothetical protein [Verrucomicrobiae bacterium]
MKKYRAFRIQIPISRLGVFHGLRELGSGYWRLFLFTLLALPVVGQAPPKKDESAFRPALLFADHMVLQRDGPLPVWGKGEPDDLVTVEFAGQQKTAKVAADGNWRVTLDPLAASTESRLMRIHSARSGRTIVIHDVLVGEVWLCSGQSNMEMPVGNLYRPDVYPGVVDCQREVASATNTRIRLLRVEHQTAAAPMHDVPSSGWQVCSPESAARFSAVGYFFARELQPRLEVPIGVISSAWSSTGAEAWCSPSGLRTLPKFSRRWERFQAACAANQSSNKPREIRR